MGISWKLTLYTCHWHLFYIIKKKHKKHKNNDAIIFHKKIDQTKDKRMYVTDNISTYLILFSLFKLLHICIAGKNVNRQQDFKCKGEKNEDTGKGWEKGRSMI